MMLLLPVIAGIGDRLALLRGAGALTAQTRELLDQFANWIRSGGDASEQETARMQDAIARATPGVTKDADWSTIVSASLLGRLAELADIAHDVRALHRQVLTGSARLPALRLARGLGPDATRYHDYGMALLSAFAAMVAIGLVCGFWIATAWPDGASAALFAAVLCSFFAAQDDPVPAILSFSYCTAIAIIIVAVYLFAILPMVTSFEMLVFALAPTFLILGVLIARPATFIVGLATAANASALLALTDTYHAAFADYVNTALASLSGMAAAATVTAIMRSVGAAWSTRRLQRAGWRDIARAASRWGTIERPALAALMLDQLADLTTRLAASDLHADLVFRDALRDLRIGLNVLELEHESPDLLPQARASLRAMLDGIDEYYRKRAPEPPDATLRAHIDEAIAAVVAAPSRLLAPVLMHLVGIRYGLFPDAEHYRAAVPATALEGPR